MRDLNTILAKFEELVSPNFCYQLALKKGFIQRLTSKIKGFEFAQALMVPHGFLDAETLNTLASRMHKINPECSLSAPALAQRMNSKGAEKFMKACFEKLLREVIAQDFVKISDVNNLAGFNRILIEDSTMAELHEKLSPQFKGRGGAASKAAVKIDYIFDYLSEQFVDISFHSGNMADVSLSKKVMSTLQEDDLLIRDLGYFTINSIKQIAQQGAYYISRFKSGIVVYQNQESDEPIHLAKFIAENSINGVFDEILYISKEKCPVRMVACLMSEEAINKRRRETKRMAQRTGHMPGKKKLDLLNYSIFITNVPAEILYSTSVIATYRARWRIELIFKSWKSCLKLHIFKGYRLERFRCLMYGRLIMVLLIGSLTPVLMEYALGHGKELSCFKFTNYLIVDNQFAQALYGGGMNRFISNLLEDVPRRLCMDKRKRQSLRCNVRNGCSYGMDDKFATAA